MIQTSKRVRLIVILIALWTIVQTIFHVFWVIYCYMILNCSIRPIHYDIIFVYLTYLYKKSCGPIHLEEESFFMSKPPFEYADVIAPGYQLQNGTATYVLYKFIKEVLRDAALPDRSNVATRTEMYLILIFIGDMLWIVSAVCMLVGVFWKIRQKYVSVLFYGPWLICTAFVCFLDVVSSVHYGLDLIFIRSFTSWLKFIGVTNYKHFSSYDDYPSSQVTPAIPATVLISLLSRVFFVWLTNVVCFFAILFMAIPELFWKTPGTEQANFAKDSKLRLDTGGELNLNSSEARIRNWQLFYGAIEANSTMASGSAGTSSSASGDRRNSRIKFREANDTSGAYYDNISFDQSLSEEKFSSQSSGVAKVAVVDANNVNVPALKGHIPWSYITPNGCYVPPTRCDDFTENNYISGTRL